MGRPTCLLTASCLALASGCAVNQDSSSDAASTAGTTALCYVDGTTASYSGYSGTASSTDQSVVCVANSGVLTLTSCTMSSTGSTSSASDSLACGLDAVVLAKSGGSLTVSGGTVTSTGTGAAGAFATGSGTSASLSGVGITTAGDDAPGTAATRGATLTLTNCTVTTSGDGSPALGMASGTGAVTLSSGTFSTTGSDAPALQVHGTVAASGTTLAAAASDGVQLTPGYQLSLTNANLSVYGSGHRGVAIRQSGTTSGTGTFTMAGGALSTASGPAFFVSNAAAAITLSSSAAISSGSGVLVEAGVTSSYGTAGGTVQLTATGVSLTGDLVTDDTSSTIAATLGSSSSLTGTINMAALTLDATSTWTLTGNSVLTTLSDTSGISGTYVANIIGPYRVTYDNSLSANAGLGGLTYSLNGGGTLAPR
jgi:hypothetical protein